MVLNMVKGLIGKKINMTQVFDSHGRSVPATRLQVDPNVILQVKELEKDGYKSIQLGFGKSKKPTKPATGHAKAAGLDFVPRDVREVSFDGELKSGKYISVDQVFRKGYLVDVSGLSKGKGFAGVVKRWGFAGGPRTHGQSDRERAAGSIGATTTPGRVFKGMKMAGHMGNQQVTTRGLEIIDLDKEKSEIIVKGSIPGATGNIVLIKKSKKEPKAYHEPEIPAVPQIGGEKEGTKEAEAEQKEAKPKDHGAETTEQKTSQEQEDA